MKIKKIITEKFSALGSWLSYWIPIILAILVFVLCSAMIGGLIGKHIWIIFAADLVFYCLFWVLLKLYPRYYQYNSKDYREKIKRIVPLVIVIVILFILIVMATFGVSVVTSQKMLLNIFIFIVGLIVTIAVFMSREEKLKNAEEKGFTPYRMLCGFFNGAPIKIRSIKYFYEVEIIPIYRYK